MFCWQSSRFPLLLLPPLLIAWPDKPGQPSGDTHRAIWERAQAGDVDLRKQLIEERLTRGAAEYGENTASRRG